MIFAVLGGGLVATAVAHLAAVAAVAADRRGASSRLIRALLPAALGVLATLAATALQPLAVAAACGAVVAVACGAYAWVQRELSASGAVLWASHLVLGAVFGVWSLMFLARLQLSAVTTGLLWLAVPLTLISAPSALVQTREAWEPLIRRVWRRPQDAILHLDRTEWPFVSIHVPCHAEPPELVIQTLDRLAALDYPSYEVVVIDNNTTDESLWRPLEEHCARLGSRFRFLHVEGITGAKAGALNWAFPQTDPRAEVIGVVDADYWVEPEWLQHTMGHFDDPAMGFVQCPHAYRDTGGSAFLRMADAEYSVFFTTGMVSLNEHNSGLTVGTMSLVRRSVLAEVGGWAEWCLTEDSELAIRIHAAGYESVYLRRPYGRGLIPETFAGYRQQRFRWTYGPVQELRRHWRLFLPGRWATPSALSWRQRVHHGNHGLDVVLIGIRSLLLPLGAAAAVSMIVHGERVPVPYELWIATTALLVGALALRWIIYRRVVGATLREAIGGVVAFAGLSWVITVASLTALIGRDVPWRRTNKFRSSRAGLRVFASAGQETAVGTLFLAAASMAAVFGNSGLTRMFAIGLALQALTYLASPLLAGLADRGLRQQIEAVAGGRHALRPVSTRRRRRLPA